MKTDAEIIICLFKLLHQDQGRTVISSELAESMCLSRASMHHRVEKLIKLDLVEKTVKKKLYLTDKGMTYAHQLRGQHDEISAFFEASCGLTSAEAEQCAGVLVAELSDEARERMCGVVRRA